MIVREWRTARPSATPQGCCLQGAVNGKNRANSLPRQFASILEDAFATPAVVRAGGEEDGQHVPGVKQEGADPEQP